MFFLPSLFENQLYIRLFLPSLGGERVKNGALLLEGSRNIFVYIVCAKWQTGTYPLGVTSSGR